VADVTPPGLAPFCAAEIAQYVLPHRPPAPGVEPGGAKLRGDLKSCSTEKSSFFVGDPIWSVFIRNSVSRSRTALTTLYRANLHLRTPSRMLVRLGEFHVENFDQLRARRL